MSDHFVNDILPNKLGITNQHDLMDYEEKIVAEKIITLLKESEAFEPDLDYFKHIHKVLFEDLYDFAGKFRTVDIVKTDSNFPFCFAQFLPSESERIFGDLKTKNYLKNLAKPDFIQGIADLSTELNALHPFREGNGRALRIFTEQLVIHAGYDIQRASVDSERWLYANKTAVFGDESELVAIFKDVISEIADEH